jgi:hypothetical protein
VDDGIEPFQHAGIDVTNVQSLARDAGRFLSEGAALEEPRVQANHFVTRCLDEGHHDTPDVPVMACYQHFHLVSLEPLTLHDLGARYRNDETPAALTVLGLLLQHLLLVVPSQELGQRRIAEIQDRLELSTPTGATFADGPHQFTVVARASVLFRA